MRPRASSSASRLLGSRKRRARPRSVVQGPESARAPLSRLRARGHEAAEDEDVSGRIGGERRQSCILRQRWDGCRRALQLRTSEDLEAPVPAAIVVRNLAAPVREERERPPLRPGRAAVVVAERAPHNDLTWRDPLASDPHGLRPGLRIGGLHDLDEQSRGPTPDDLADRAGCEPRVRIAVAAPGDPRRDRMDVAVSLEDEESSVAIDGERSACGRIAKSHFPVGHDRERRGRWRQLGGVSIGARVDGRGGRRRGARSGARVGDRRRARASGAGRREERSEESWQENPRARRALHCVSLRARGVHGADPVTSCCGHSGGDWSARIASRGGCDTPRRSRPLLTVSHNGRSASSVAQ